MAVVYAQDAGVIGPIVDRFGWLVQSLAWNLPRELLTRQAVGVGRMVGALRGNARVLVLTTPYWAVPLSFSAVYLQIFMQKVGLTPIEIGSLASFQLAMQVGGALFGGWLVERLGARRTLIRFDAVLYPSSFACFALAEGYPLFLAGSLLLGLTTAIGPAWTALFVSGVAPSRRMAVFGLHQVSWLLSSLAVPVCGLLVHRGGVQATSRLVFAVSAVLVLAGVWTRARRLAGPVEPAPTARPTPDELVRVCRDHLRAARALLARRELAVLLLVQVLAAAIVAVGGTWLNVFLANPQGKALTTASLAVLPLASSASQFLISLIVIPFVTLSSLYGFLILANGLFALHVHLVLLAPAGALSTVFIATLAGAAGWALFNPLINAYWANCMSDRERPRLLAFSNVLIMVCAMPAPMLAGSLYHLDPRGPLLLLLGLCTGMLVLLCIAAARWGSGRMAVRGSV